MRALLRFSVRNLPAMLVLTVLVLAAGLYAAFMMPKEDMPAVRFPLVSVLTPYPGGSVEEINNKVTKPIEKALTGTPGLKRLQSLTAENSSLVMLELLESQDVDKARQAIQERVQQAAAATGQVWKPLVQTFGFETIPILHLSATSTTRAPVALQAWVEQEVRPRLEQITGVASVSVRGETPSEVRISLLPEAMRKHRLSFPQVQQALGQLNLSLPMGQIATGQQSLPVRLEEKVGSLEDLRALVLPTPTGGVRLGELATLESQPPEQRVTTLTNGEPSVAIEVVKAADANILEVAKEIDRLQERLVAQYPDIQLQKLFDFSQQVERSVTSMLHEGLLGALFAALVILGFLRNLRVTTIAVVSIPLSAIATFLVLYPTSITLNIMTLGGLAVAVGRVVDDSIVIIENIHRRILQHGRCDEKLVCDATQEVAAAVTTSTLTTVAVFIPLSFVQGVAGKVFFPMAVTVTLSLLLSLFVSLTLVPSLAHGFFRKWTPKATAKATPPRVATWYRQALRWSLARPKRVLAGSTAVLLASLLLLPLLGTAFLPTEKQRSFQVGIQMPGGASFAASEALAQRASQVLQQLPGVKVVSALVGNPPGAPVAMAAASGGAGATTRLLVKVAEDFPAAGVLQSVRAALLPLQSEAVLNVEEVRGAGPPSSSLQVIVRGPQANQVRGVADYLVADFRQHVKGWENIAHNRAETRPQVTIDVDEKKAARRGLVPAQVAQQIRSLLSAEQVMVLPSAAGYLHNVVLRAGATSLEKVAEISRLPLFVSAARAMPPLTVGDVASVQTVELPAVVYREQGLEAAKIAGHVTSTDTGGVSRQIQERLQQVALPAGVEVSLGGDVERMNESFYQLGLAMVAAVFAVFIIMVVAFGNMRVPFTILFSLPYAVVGGLIALYLTDQPISVSALIGALMLIGIVVTNAIVLLDCVVRMQARGLSLHAAILDAAETRLRPILMTALATIFALSPLAFGFGEGTLISRGLAAVVIGGLTSSTLLTLFVVPLIYVFLSGGRKSVGAKK